MTRTASGATASVTPYMVYRDAVGGIAFIVAVFGAVEVLRHVEPGGRIAHAQLRIPGPAPGVADSLLMIAQANPQYPDMPPIEDRTPSPIGLFVEVADADATVARAVGLGATLIHPLGDQEYGRSGSVRDPFGCHWHITSQPSTP